MLTAITLFLGFDAFRTDALNNFNVTYTPKLCNALPSTFPVVPGNPACAEVLTTDTAVDTTNTNCFNGPGAGITDCAGTGATIGSKNFSSVITYIPAGYQTFFTLDPGELAGGASNLVGLGALNQECNQNFPVDFIFYNVPLPSMIDRAGAATANPRASNNILVPRQEGAPNRFGGWLFTVVKAGDPNAGNALAALPAGQTAKFVDTSGDGIWQPGEPVYLAPAGDANVNNNIHTKLSAAAAAQGALYTAFPAGQPVKFVDTNGNGTREAGEQVFIDYDTTGTVTNGDQRLSAAAVGGGVAPLDAGADNKADSGSLPLSGGYPEYLLDVFDPDFIPGASNGSANPVVPKAVYLGLTQPVPASNDWVPLAFVQFAPGDLAAAGFPADHPFSKAVTSLGSPSVTVLNDPTSVKASISSISDFCTPVLAKIMLKGTGGNNHVRFKTPIAAGTYFHLNWSSSLRDADGDGRENSYDTCATTADNFAVGTPPGDSDNDGIYDSCDTVANGTLGPGVADPSDFDGDGFDNRQDNCPLVANGLALDGQADSELSQGGWPADGGPKTDSIGDACDAAPTVANGDYNLRGNVTAKCIGATDADGDGYCVTDQDAGTDAAPANHKAWAAPLTGAANGDTDKDTVGVKTDWQETFMGTDATKRCAADTVVNNEPLPDRWPFDFNDDRKAALADVLAYIPVFGNVTGTVPRYDQNQDGKVGLADVLAFIPVFNVSCVP